MRKEVNGAAVNFEVNGNGEETVVFVHGLGGSLNVWHSQQAVASRYYKTLSYDLRGSGRSDIANCDYSIELWVEDLKALLDSEKIDQPHLVGWSMGTLIVQHFSSKYPSRAASQTLVGPLVELPEAGKKNTFKRAEVVEAEGMDAVADAIIQGGTASFTKYDKPALIGLIRDVLLRNNPEAYAASCRALANGKAVDHTKVEVPTLLVVGAEDNVTPVPVATRLYNAFPNAQLEVIADAGHWTTVEKPNEINQALIKFLQTAKQTSSVNA
ncbi:alpha/beta fold hydrolase [Bacillus thermotolerans]|mgnify:CR=1 FL=1|uniref:alpha/beta fold hydrolase n=1 Tax=Bacillus thermotolerans TaxID=1221996 RepID=UPI00058390D7|nr:alpha/beta fold hydrolase [Bacillus thermotolerans]KKB33618.1 Beta-ketoadipate enol-lactone hydrolase [Bacillus thermotolerans]